MIEAPTPCKAQIELETLSAWRDRALASGEYRRLTEHVATCTACQYRLHVFDTIGELLQMRDTDHYQEQIWQRLHAKSLQSATSRLAILPRLIVATSVVIIIALFALVTYQRAELQQGHPLATATSLPPTTPASPTLVPAVTPIVLTPSQLYWQPTAPRAWNAAGDGETVWFAPAPSDGTQNYICTQLPGTTVVHLWKTNNRGANWLALGTLPSVANGTCNLTVDQSNPDLVILGITQNARTTPIDMQSYISHDGGKTWQTFLQGEYILEIVFGTTSYAVLSDTSSNNKPYMTMSRDGYKTWQNIMPSTVMPFDFWVSRTGELLLASNPNKMWLTDDQGQTWRSIPVPNHLSYTQAFQSAGSTIWNICGKVEATKVYCSRDNGQTWHSYIAPGSPDSMALLGMTSDDTLILDLFANSPTPQQQIYRFSPQQGQWQLLGSVPDATVAFTRATNGAGILWSWYTADPGDDAQQRNFSTLLP